MASEGRGSFTRRDQLLKIQAEVHQPWEAHDVFKAESGDKPLEPGEKFFGNFSYPYMNGSLHLGHVFFVSKLEFAAAYHRRRGSNVLLPFAFHCTGMLIKASADKLDREIKKFGNPPVFPSVDNEPDVVEEEDKVDESGEVAPDKFKKKRSKVAAKSGGDKYQWEIMKIFGLSDPEIVESGSC